MIPFVPRYPASMGYPNWCYHNVISGVLSGLMPVSRRCQPLSLRLITQSSHKQLSLKHLLDKDFKSYLPLIMQQLTFSPAYDSLWIQ